MTYDPLKRGEYRVGVTTIGMEVGDRNVPVEIWYPATEDHRGQPIDVYTVADGLPSRTQNAERDARCMDGKFPLVIQLHAAVGHRRDSAPTCTHLASHGYIVVSPEFVGDTSADLLHDAAIGQTGEAKRALPMVENLSNREQVSVATLNAILASEFADRIAVGAIGAFGVSLGGWTTLRLLSLDRRVKAAFIAAPSWGTHGPFEDTKLQHSMVRLDDWGRQVPVFLVAGERDGLIPLEDMCELRSKLPRPRRFGVLRGASHFHWFEDAENTYNICRQMWESGTLSGADVDALRRNSPAFSELCPSDHGIETLRALCLAQMDAELKQNSEAKSFLERDLVEVFKARGIDLYVPNEQAGAMA